jgi:hypothetical protein
VARPRSAPLGSKGARPCGRSCLILGILSTHPLRVLLRRRRHRALHDVHACILCLPSEINRPAWPHCSCLPGIFQNDTTGPTASGSA